MAGGAGHVGAAEGVVPAAVLTSRAGASGQRVRPVRREQPVDRWTPTGEPRLVTATNTSVPDLASLLTAYDIVDLSVALDEKYPVSWPGAALFHHHVANSYDGSNGASTANGPYKTHTVIYDEHTGTHFDAPTHFIPPPDSGLPHAGPAGEISGDKVPLDQLVGRAVVVDCRSLRDGEQQPGISPIITPELIAADESRNGEIRPGDAVLFWTGWDVDHMIQLPEGQSYAKRPFLLKDAPAWPAPDVDAARYLHEKGVRMIATDGTSMGPAHDGAPVHWYGLGEGMVFIEGCAGFGQLPPRDAVFVFLPVKVAGSTGGPGRAVAFVPRAS